MANGQNTSYIIGRLSEPSTWASLAALLSLFGVPIGAPEVVTQVGVAVAGIAGVLLQEKTAG